MNTTTKTTKHRNNLRRAALALAALMLTTATAWAQWSGNVKVNIEGSGTVTLTHGGTTENFSSNGTSSSFSGDYTITFLPSGGNVVNKVMLKSAFSVSGATDITNQLSDIDGGKSYSSSLSWGTDEYTVYFGAQGAASFYTLTSDMQSGGTMTFSVGGETVTTAEEGQRVDITLSDPGSSYYWEVSSLNVSPITQDDATHFHFTMPATDVTVKAEKYMQTTLTYGIIDNSTHGHVNWSGGNWAGNFNGGETATLTVQPDAGYEYVAGTLSATNQSTNEAIALTDCGDGTWTFTMPAASVVVSATFTVISNCYVVHFDKNRDDAFGEMDDQVFTVGVAQELSRCIFSISGIYEFAGWATTADGEAVYYDKQEVTDIAAAGETITLYATWRKPLTYFTVHFDKNSDDAQGVMQDQSFVAGVAKQLFGNRFTREGYAFAGWNLNADGSDSTTYEDKAFFTGSGTDIVLYAQWTSDLAHFSVNNDGSYTIKTATGWSVFCDCSTTTTPTTASAARP